MRWRRLLSRALLLAVMLTALTVSAQADAVTDTIGVYIGYFGWSEDEYVEKATYHWTELDDWYGGRLDTHEVVYSYYNGARTYLARGRGFYIRDLLEYAGVDLNSIASIDFFTKDHANGAYRSFTKKSLFDTPRYYFPYLAANEETGALYSADGGVGRACAVGRRDGPFAYRRQRSRAACVRFGGGCAARRFRERAHRLVVERRERRPGRSKRQSDARGRGYRDRDCVLRQR